MKVCRNGVTRLVILLGSRAFKIPRFGYGWKMGLSGLLSNMQEREWAGADERLCPIVFSTWGGWLVVQRRARPFTDREWAEFMPRMEAWIEGKEMRVPVETKRDSFGVLDGRIVAVDYGS